MISRWLACLLHSAPAPTAAPAAAADRRCSRWGCREVIFRFLDRANWDGCSGHELVEG